MARGGQVVGSISPAAPGSAPDAPMPVSVLTAALKDVVEGAFPSLWISGEVSGFKSHRNGHWYFTLKDASAALDCVVWSSAQARFPAPPDDGMQVVALGRFSVWAKTGKPTFAVTAMEAEGEGLWRKAFEKTRAALERDGLLAPERKRPLPRFPRVVGVVTSASGAAMHDIVSVIARRNPGVDVVVANATVQGDAAPPSIVAAIERMGRWGGADLLIVGRGGGSREDLWSFNDERVARAIAASPIPTVSAVGHEVDVSIADLVADVRAATPTAAAEIAVPVLADLVTDLAALRDQMTAALTHRARDGRRRLDLVRSLAANAVQRRITGARRELSLLVRDVRSRAQRVAERRRERLAALGAHIHLLSPYATLSRGYALPRGPDGRVLSRVSAFKPGAAFTLKIQDGEVDATTNAVRTDKGSA